MLIPNYLFHDLTDHHFDELIDYTIQTSNHPQPKHFTVNIEESMDLRSGNSPDLNSTN